MQSTNKAHALVVLSGGQDSVTILGMCLKKFDKVSAISFAYNQRHRVELESARDLCVIHHVAQTQLDLGMTFTGLVNSALTDPLAGDDAVTKPHPDKPGLPASFVPGRNALFLTLAHAHAQTIGAGVIAAGMCQTDYSGYPDCRDLFIQKLGIALNLGYETDISFWTPLMHLNKAHTFYMAAMHDFLGHVINNSHTCYNGDHTTAHEWGYGCGECPACKLRAAGWDAFKLQYPDLAAPYIAGGGKSLV
jgi:7-cyano-7-deazaguanine synthase